MWQVAIGSVFERIGRPLTTPDPMAVSSGVSVSKSVALRINEHDHEDDYDEEELRQSDACEHAAESLIFCLAIPQRNGFLKRQVDADRIVIGQARRQ